jgi:amino acid adenylation domain-containing protein/thioester reductase-like protein
MFIIEKFINIATNHPEAIALEDRNRSYTYKEMDELTSYLAGTFTFDENELIGLKFEKSLEYILTLFAVLKKGNPFLVLNKQLPEDRIKYMEETANIKTLLNSEMILLLLEKYKKSGRKPHAFKCDLHLDKLAYIIFTSGSTGNPKGVKVTHRGIFNLIKEQIEMFELKTKSKLLLTNSISFDASLSDIFSTLLSGATLVIENEQKNLIQSMRDFKITHLDISPSVLNVLYQDMPLNHLQAIVVGGELLSKNVISYLSHRIKLINVYGPTETTICNSMKVLDDLVEPNCIGKPINGVEYTIVDGELVIVTEASADGYINADNGKFELIDGKRAYKTGDYVEFKNGEYYFLGRKDRQVKIKGFRVELEEIESILKKITSCDLLAVVYKYERLVCFSTTSLSMERIEELPYYMRPDAYVVIDEFQKNSNGKIDYHVLEKEVKTQKRNDIVQILEEILKKKVNLTDTWETLGGDSLDLISVILAFEENNIVISTESLLNNTMIGDLLDESKNTIELTTDFLKTTTPVVKTTMVVKPSSVEKVFITGVTGFLGSHFLEKLLKESKEEEYYCLIRANSIEKAKKKLEDVFARFELDSPLLISNRIKIVLGDLSKERFGMSDNEYQSLKETITKVVHSAAIVNNILPYDEMFTTNVAGTIEVIKLQKPIHYISTLSVFVGTDKNTGIVYENDDLTGVTTAYGGYAQSKYVSEYLIRESKLPSVIYRFGLLTSHTKKNNYNKKEFLMMLLQGLKRLKCLPDINLSELCFDVSPIDFAVNVMFDVYQKGEFGKTYHIANKDGASLELLKQTFEENNERIYLISKEEFKRLVLSSNMDINTKSVLLTMCRFDEELYKKYRHFDLFQRTNIDFDMKNTLELTNIAFPEINTALIGKYITILEGK